MPCISREEYQERRKRLIPIIESLKRQQLQEAFRLFDSMRNMGYQEKINYTQRIIEDSMHRFGDRIAVACSFGKDSTLVLYFAVQVDPSIKVLFNNTGIEHRETYWFRDFLAKEWSLNIHETKPIKNFWECVKEYGYPKMRYPSHGTPACCYYLKERPAALWYQENDIEAVFLGTTWDESYQRRFTIIRYGDTYKTKKHLIQPITKIHPLAFWNTEEVWRYIKENNIPYNKIYDRGVERCGCAPCTGYIGWMKKMASVNPTLFRKVFHDLGGRQLTDFIEKEVPMETKGSYENR